MVESLFTALDSTRLFKAMCRVPHFVFKVDQAIHFLKLFGRYR